MTGGMVNNCTESDLRAAMAGGGTVTFACDGTITLSNTITNTVDTVLDGTGHQVTISGGNAVRLFYVTNGVTFSVFNLTLANGFSSGGSAILNAGKVSLVGATLRTNLATSAGPADVWPPGAGGALFNLGGVVGATNCSFVGNQAYQQWYYGPARGGAIHNESGQANLERCVFVANGALGGSARYPWDEGFGAAGGAVYNNQGALATSACTFTNNSAIGGDSFYPEAYGARGGPAWGGAVFNAGAATVTADRSTFAGNSARGGNGAEGYTGPVINYQGQPGGTGGDGRDGDGGALFNSGAASLINCTIVGNQGVGGSGGPGGQGGGLPQPAYGGGPGGNGGNGGNGFGGVDGTCALIHCTLAFNVGIGGSGGAAGPGGTGVNSSGAPGLPGTSGTASGGGTVCTNLVNSLIASNSPAGNDSFPDPKLAPLADNGGPTLTMALLPGSPAIDAGDTATAPPTDQRGFPRPVGLGVDIGAYELCSLPVLRLAIAQAGIIDVTLFTSNQGTCHLLTSSNLCSWLPIATNQVGSDGTFVFHDNFNASRRFYRVVMP